MRELSFQELQDARPPGGLFAGKDWLLSPRPLALPRARIRQLVRLGYLLERWQRAQEELYLRSAAGRLPAWLAAPLDAGKPDWLVAAGRSAALAGQRPEVIRPDLLLQERGFALTELDSVPGGIGLTHWLNRTYAQAGWEVLGGAEGMVQGFAGLFRSGRGQILVSEESASYRPEMEWLAAEANQHGSRLEVASAESAQVADGEEIYRFFELFDHAAIPGARELIERAAAGQIHMTSPPRAFFEEKLWAALLWLSPLRHTWDLATRRSRVERLRRLVPRAWLMDPTPLPYLGEHPQLGVHELQAVGGFSQRERNLILKISGFSDQAWGSRGVLVGSDVPAGEWRDAVDRALRLWGSQPRLLQEFAPTTLVRQPYWNPVSGQLEEMEGRVRLCPYFFRHGGFGPKLGGVLATIVPADKKLIHGMKDGILCPVVEA